MKKVVIKTVEGNPTIGNPLTPNAGPSRTGSINFFVNEVPDDVSPSQVLDKYRTSLVVSGGKYEMTWQQLNVPSGQIVFLNRV